MQERIKGVLNSFWGIYAMGWGELRWRLTFEEVAVDNETVLLGYEHTSGLQKGKAG